MSKECKNKIVPKLRFKAFNGLNWEHIKLNSIAKLNLNKNKSNKINRVLTNSAANGVVDQRDFFDKDIADKDNLDSYYIVELGDYVYNPRISNIAPVGPISKNKIGDGVMSPLYTVFRFLNDNNDFYEQYFKTSHWHKYLREVSNTGARFDRMSITPSIFMEMPVPYIDLQEQQKIASCLSSLDDLISAQTQKLETLKNYKKGLMQQLFPQEGETTPNIRFPVFNEGWKKVKLKDVSSYFNGGSYENDVKGEGKYELITLKSINTNGTLVNSKRYIDIEVPTLTKGTLVMILSEQAPGLLGMTAIISTDNKYVLNQRVAEIRPNQKVDSYFLSMAINRNQNYFSKHGAGTKVQNISKPNVENYEFMLPEIQEQQKIATCFSSLDELINAQNQKIETLKTHKKGLMQQLFPNMR